MPRGPRFGGARLPRESYVQARELAPCYVERQGAFQMARRDRRISAFVACVREQITPWLATFGFSRKKSALDGGLAAVLGEGTSTTEVDAASAELKARFS